MLRFNFIFFQVQHIFKDVDGTTYLLWKTDDNSVGSKTTRLWGQQIAIKSGSVSLLGTRKQLMDSSGLWWVQSFIAGGSLIEGPELIHRGDYYYLFCECRPSLLHVALYVCYAVNYWTLLF